MTICSVVESIFCLKAKGLRFGLCSFLRNFQQCFSYINAVSSNGGGGYFSDSVWSF